MSQSISESYPAETQQVALARNVRDRITVDDFAIVRRTISPPREGEVVVHNLVTSVDPYHLRLLRGGQGHGHQLLGRFLMANCVGVVVESRDERAPVGTQVATYTGWTEYATMALADTDFADRDMGDERDWIQTLGTPGITALIGLTDVAQVQGDELVVVSGAAGAVGGVAVQIAKAAGARVIAIAGGRDRVRHTVEMLGANVGLDYKTVGFEARLLEETSSGVDIFFDNVGGKLLETLSRRMARNGRIVVCGAITSYAGGTSSTINVDIALMMRQRSQLRAFNVGDYYPRRLLPARAALAAMVRNGSVRTIVTEYPGLAAAPAALMAVFETGSSDVGKRIVRISTA